MARGQGDDAVPIGLRGGPCGAEHIAAAGAQGGLGVAVVQGGAGDEGGEVSLRRGAGGGFAAEERLVEGAPRGEHGGGRRGGRSAQGGAVLREDGRGVVRERRQARRPRRASQAHREHDGGHNGRDAAREGSGHIVGARRVGLARGCHPLAVYAPCPRRAQGAQMTL